MKPAGFDDIDVEVRGEIYMPISSFDKLNKIQLENNFKNPKTNNGGSIFS